MSSKTTTTSERDEAGVKQPGLWSDLMTLTKFRLSFLVLVTAMTGYLMRGTAPATGALMFHTLIGAALSAFGAAVFNQLLEIQPDSLMKRTSDRPLPAGRMSPAAAFVIGTVLSAFGVLHLSLKVNLEAGLLAAATLFLYIFVYTPMKRVSSWNTVVGAISGALPPLIGWTAAAGAPGDTSPVWRNSLFLENGAIYLFGLLFLWQMPHFIAINWMYREEYERAGYVMWSGGDVSGRRSSWLIFWNSAALAAFSLWPFFAGLTTLAHGIPMILLNIPLIWLAVGFVRKCERKAARNVFLYTTVVWLPLALIVSVLGWKHAA